jgi:hypothetical protein
MNPKTTLRQRAAVHSTATGERVAGVEFDPRNMQPWPATVAGVRDVALRWLVTAADFSQTLPLLPEAKDFCPTAREVEAVSEAVHDAVTYGRVIDFGELPNEMIKLGGRRGGPMWNKGYFGQPFRDPWVLYHTWDGGDHIGVYLVKLIERDKPNGDVEVVELQPIQFGSDRMLLISDRGLFTADAQGDLPGGKYHCSVAPAMIRFMPGEEGRRANNGDTPQASAAGNIGDPLMTALMILNTKDIERTTIRAPDKLQKARSKSGKLPIPPYDRVNAAPYVTAILSRRKAGDRVDLGGHHASPVPHIRRGHPRVYANGSSTFVRDTLVNVANGARDEFLRTRSHYNASQSS